jgi:hypothetical protein
MVKDSMHVLRSHHNHQYPFGHQLQEELMK